jgi:hypothetical protein
MKKHLALYGNAKITRGWCYVCRRYAFVVDGAIQCCDRPVDDQAPTRARRMSEPLQSRKLPPPKWRAWRMEQQGFRCFYCDRAFDSSVVTMSGGRVKKRRLMAVWDHMTPFKYSQDNRDHNFVAACCLCNGIKRDKIFQTIEEARLFLAARWAEILVTEAALA